MSAVSEPPFARSMLRADREAVAWLRRLPVEDRLPTPRGPLRGFIVEIPWPDDEPTDPSMPMPGVYLVLRGNAYLYSSVEDAQRDLEVLQDSRSARKADDTDDEALEMLDATDPEEAAGLRALRQAKQRARGEID